MDHTKDDVRILGAKVKLNGYNQVTQKLWKAQFDRSQGSKMKVSLNKPKQSWADPGSGTDTSQFTSEDESRGSVSRRKSRKMLKKHEKDLSDKSVTISMLESRIEDVYSKMQTMEKKFEQMSKDIKDILSVLSREKRVFPQEKLIERERDLEK